jgi:putative membrane protein
VLAKILIALVAVEHVLFFLLESVFWSKPLGRKVFGFTQEYATLTASLAANQGLYNGFLAAGLVWALLAPEPGMSRALAIFFLSCVVVAGIFGAITVNRTILFLQAVPAALALLAVLFA